MAKIERNGVIYGSGDSSDIAFDPTVKNVLDATTVNVQDAIDELSTKPSGIQSKTKTDYDALADKTGSYVVTDDDYPLMANEVSYDNTASGLTATHVQNAIDEVNTKANEVKYSNPNLLDNPWFTVNQRGTTNVSAFGYLVDRWICTGGSVSNNQITIVQDKYLYQRFEKDMIPLGTQLTVSVKFDDDTIRHGNMIYSSTYTNDVDSDVTFELQQATNFGYLGIRAKNSDRTIKSVKMELGNISTIANDVAPNYATELVKCQRYYYKLSAGASLAGYVWGTTEARVAVPNTFRATPTIVANSISSSNIIANGKMIAVNSVSVVNANDFVRLAVVPSTNFDTTDKYHACILKLDSIIELSADL